MGPNVALRSKCLQPQPQCVGHPLGARCASEKEKAVIAFPGPCQTLGRGICVSLCAAGLNLTERTACAEGCCAKSTDHTL